MAEVAAWLSASSLWTGGVIDHVDHHLIAAREFQRAGIIGPVEHGRVESIRLGAVLVGHAEALNGDRPVIAAQLDRLVTVSIGVEGRHDAEKPFVAVEGHELSRRHAHRDVEIEMKARKPQPCARGGINAQLPIDRGMGDGFRLCPGDEAGGDRRIDPDVAQRAAALGRIIADVCGVGVEEAECTLNMDEPADGAATDQLTRADPLGDGG